MPKTVNLSRVFIGVEPLVDRFANQVGQLEASIFGDSRASHASVVVLYDDSLAQYEVLLKNVKEKSMAAENRILASFTHVTASSTSANGADATNTEDGANDAKNDTKVAKTPEELQTEAFLQWTLDHPHIELTQIGWTSKGHEEVVAFCDDWNKQKRKYNAFLVNCRTFVDSLSTFVVTHEPAWKIKVTSTPLPVDCEENETATAMGATKGIAFQSALEYIHWRRKKVKKQRDLMRNHPAFKAVMGDDGRVSIEISAPKKKVDKASGSAIESSDEEDEEEEDAKLAKAAHRLSKISIDNYKPGVVPRLSIVIMIVGSRGDVQPFLALGQELLKHGHRIRLATHATFKGMVKDAGLEFFPLAGDPAELMAFMVKNPGLLPGYESLTNGDIGEKRRTMAEILDSAWHACVDADPDTKAAFSADAIISNPPTFAHIHVAERLGIPLHIFFTMPWSPTKHFPHPLTTISQSSDTNKSELRRQNYFSYDLMEVMAWQGLGDIINKFREKTLGLHELSSSRAPFLVKTLEVPHTYCWSPNLIPKPSDWGSHIDIVGFFFIDLAKQSNYSPPEDLKAFLAAGPPPVYIGFGSIVVDDKEKLTRIVYEAVEKAGVRAIVSKG
ncbi:hypothetical protein HK102_013167, partial [Quaeritorhiza haematococci]